MNMAKAFGFLASGEIRAWPSPGDGPIREQCEECLPHPLRMEPHTFLLNNFQAQLSRLQLGISMSPPPFLSLTEATFT